MYVLKTNDISIDEIMVSCYEHHPCKQHIHGKSIRFGYKLLLAATPNEYLIYFIPYHESKSSLRLEQARICLALCLLCQTCRNDRFIFY